MLHSGHVSINKMDKLAEAFWWPELHRDIREKAENCPSCRVAGKNLETQLPLTEINRLELLTDLAKISNWILLVQSNQNRGETFTF